MAVSRHGPSQFVEAQDLRALFAPATPDSAASSAAVQPVPASTSGAPLCWMIWASLAAGSVGSRGKKCTAGLLHRDHCSQEVDAAFGEQDNHFIAADALAASRPAMAEPRLRELAVTEPNPPGRHRHGVGGALDLPGEPFGESAEAGETGLGLIPIDRRLACVPLPAAAAAERSARSGLATIDSSSVWKCAAIRAIVAASKSSVLYSSQPPRRPSSSMSSSNRSDRAMPGSTSTKCADSPGRAGALDDAFAE